MAIQEGWSINEKFAKLTASQRRSRPISRIHEPSPGKAVVFPVVQNGRVSFTKIATPNDPRHPFLHLLRRSSLIECTYFCLKKTSILGSQADLSFLGNVHESRQFRFWYDSEIHKKLVLEFYNFQFRNEKNHSFQIENYNPLYYTFPKSGDIVKWIAANTVCHGKLLRLNTSF